MMNQNREESRRAFLETTVAGGVSLLGLKSPGVQAQEERQNQPKVARSQFDEVKDFIEAVGRITVLTGELDAQVGRGSAAQAERWKTVRRSLQDTVSGSEDRVVAALRGEFGPQTKRGSFAGVVGERREALREAEGDLEIIRRQLGGATTRSPIRPEREEKKEVPPAPRFSSPLIVIANPFEEILARQGVYDVLGKIAKEGLDKLLSQTWSEGGLFSQKRDWKWRLDTKRFTRPQDVEPERVYEMLRGSLVTLASVDGLVRAVDRQGAHRNDPEWQVAKSRVSERLAKAEGQLREGFEACLDRTTRADGMQRLKEATSRIGLSYSLVEAFLK